MRRPRPAPRHHHYSEREGARGAAAAQSIGPRGSARARVLAAEAAQRAEAHERRGPARPTTRRYRL